MRNQVTTVIDPSGLQPPWFFILPPQGYRSWTDDERALIGLCKSDPELIRKVKILINTLDNTWVWPVGPDRCHAWCGAFIENYNDITPEDSLPCHYVFPKYIGWVPGWKDHGVVTFELNGTKFYLDKSLQGGSDHISFDPHPDLVYPDDPGGAEKIRNFEEIRTELNSWQPPGF